jgi:hypothetical protein
MEHNIMGRTTLQSQEFLYWKHGFLVPQTPKGAHKKIQKTMVWSKQNSILPSK